MSINWEPLHKYKEYDESHSCFLNGRYINIVLEGVNGFNTTPINIEISLNKRGDVLNESINSNFIRLKEGINIIRVKIKSTYLSHSALLWIDMHNMEAIYTDVVSNNASHNDSNGNNDKDKI
jgi:hypothetical protein